ncbi:unnamed protein product [Linum tenue]|uniref:Uncharacterized protein n=1 Tax=Linum tenue TaxID=586396 RepID=A0AAV0M1V5_9ROSI|nr:unnamed protein product [Linum tenue]
MSSGIGDHELEGSYNGGDQLDELSDEGSQEREKKRRLNMEQVKTSTKNFEMGNKLEPEGNMQLARVEENFACSRPGFPPSLHSLTTMLSPIPSQPHHQSK